MPTTLRCLIVALSISSTVGAADRSRALRAEFQRLHPCPATGAPRGACHGWQVDHREALVCGGRDELGNLQWLTVQEHREKTRAEVKLCRARAGVHSGPAAAGDLMVSARNHRRPTMQAITLRE